MNACLHGVSVEEGIIRENSEVESHSGYLACWGKNRMKSSYKIQLLSIRM